MFQHGDGRSELLLCGLLDFAQVQQDGAAQIHQILIELAQTFFELTLQGHPLGQQVHFCCNGAPCVAQVVVGDRAQLIKQ
jgi:hypothetical protein